MPNEIVVPKHLSNFLRENEKVHHVSKWCGVEEWVQDYVETDETEDWDGSKIYTSRPIHRKGTDLVNETLVLTDSRLFFLQYSTILKNLKKWCWMGYSSVDSVSVRPIRNRNGKILHYHFYISSGEYSRTLRSQEENFRELESKFREYAKWSFNWHQ